MPSNYTGNPTAVQAPASAPAPGVLPILSLPIGSDALTIESLYQDLKVLADYVGFGMQNITPLYGDGFDGAATLDGAVTPAWTSRVGSVYTMVRTARLTNLTLNSGITLITNGFPLYGTGVLTTSGGGANINNDGIAGSGATQGAGLGVNFLGGSGGGGNGATGSAGTSQTNSYGGSGGNGGGGGGAGGTSSVPSDANGSSGVFLPGFLGAIFSPKNGLTTLSGGSGGGGGGGGSGGGGGGGGGVMAISFRALALNAASDIHAKGGNGGNNSTGGGGGGGGAIWLVCGSVGGAVFSGATNCPGGATGTGTAGTPGSNGTVFTWVV